MNLEQALKIVDRLYRRLANRRPIIREDEEYYRGEQPLNFATREWMQANAQRYRGFSDNWCRPVVDAEAERLRHSGVKHQDRKISELLWGWWQANDGDAQSSQGFVASLTARRSFVLVWPSITGVPSMVWQHPELVEIEYDTETWRTRTAALKTWADDSNEYATLYTPTEVWKFARKRTLLRNDVPQTEQSRVDDLGSQSWQPREIPGETFPSLNPLGAVPIVEIPNRPLLFAEPVSEIEGVKPMQDAANLLWAYLFLAADYASMPARVVLHQGPPMMPILDSNGRQIGEKPIDLADLQEKRLLYLSGQSTAIDSWEAARLDVFTGVIEDIVGHIAAQTRTPPTYLVTRTGMSNVNGEGLKASEIGLVKKTIEFQTFATPAIREVYRLMALAAGETQIAQQIRTLTISWANPEIRSESQLADALMKKRSMGYPLEYLMELDGIEPTEVQRVLAMIEQERTDSQVLAASRVFGGVNVDSSSLGVASG